MAAPIAHVFLALQILAGPLKGIFNEKEFIIGTSFPDIRYLKIVERAETHVDNVTFDDIKNESSSFKAGLLFHSFVDQEREKYIVQHNMYETLPSFRFTTQSLKFAEDHLLRELFNVQQYTDYFNDILTEQLSFNIAEENIKKWHIFLQEYFTGNLSGRDLMVKYFDLNEPNALAIKRWFFSWYYARKINNIILNIVQDDEMRRLLLNFYQNFATNLGNS